MISDSQNNSSISLNQGNKFKNYQKKINKSVAKDNKKIIEGFDGDGDGSQFLKDNEEQVQNATQELDALKIQFSSLLERYNTSNSQIITNTTNFINEPPPSDPNIGKNLYVNSIVQNNEADYIGAYNDNSASPSMTRLTTGPSTGWTFEDCKNTAIKMGQEYFGLEGSGSGNNSSNKGYCSITNNLDDATKYGKNIPKCNIDNVDGKIYGNNMINALYRADGTYIGCYNDNLNPSFSGRAMEPSGPIFSSFSPVYVLGSYNMGPWSSVNFIDKTASWIWFSQNAQVDAPANSGSTLVSTFNYSGSSFLNATIYCICDNVSNVYLNSSLIGNVINGWEGGGSNSVKFSILISPGINSLYAEVLNYGGPAGFIMTILDDNNNVIFNTNSSWKFTSIKADMLNKSTQDFTVDSCKNYANDTGFSYFGVQGGLSGSSQCFVSNSLDNSKKYGQQNSVIIGDDGKYYGTDSVNAVYKLKEVGYPENMGKIGYIDKTGAVSEYSTDMYTTPNSVIETFTSSSSDVICSFNSNEYNNAYPDLNNAYHGDSESLKKHYINNGINEDRSPCGNIDLSCKFNSEMYYSLNPDVKAIGMDAKQHYIKYGIIENRPICKMIQQIPSISNDLSCPKNIVNINSIQWQALTKSDNVMDKNTKCGLAVNVQPEQLSSIELGTQLESISTKIVGLINYLGGVDSKLIEQSGINKTILTDKLSQYKNYNTKITQYKDFDSRNINGILSDSKISILHENYMYIIWFILAIIFITITIRFFQKSSV